MNVIVETKIGPAELTQHLNQRFADFDLAKAGLVEVQDQIKELKDEEEKRRAELHQAGSTITLPKEYVYSIKPSVEDTRLDSYVWNPQLEVPLAEALPADEIHAHHIVFNGLSRITAAVNIHDNTCVILDDSVVVAVIEAPQEE